jgi:hypothetical protein
MADKKLKSGRKVQIKQMSVDQIDECTDIPEVIFEDGSIKTIKNSSKARTQWIRYGLGGGDFKEYNEVSGKPTDNVIKQLTLEEKDELMTLIQDVQTLGE